MPSTSRPGIELADVMREEHRRAAVSQIAWGAALAVLGLVITSVTYSSASTAGGTYVIAYGPIIVGIVKIVRGLALMPVR
jgi:hypothetical protein